MEIATSWVDEDFLSIELKCKYYEEIWRTSTITGSILTPNTITTPCTLKWANTPAYDTSYLDTKLTSADTSSTSYTVNISSNDTINNK